MFNNHIQHPYTNTLTSMLRSQSQDLLLRGLSQDIVFGAPANPGNAKKTLTSTSVSSVSRQFRRLRLRLAVRGKDSFAKVFGFARLFALACVCMVIVKLFVGGVGGVLSGISSTSGASTPDPAHTALIHKTDTNASSDQASFFLGDLPGTQADEASSLQQPVIAAIPAQTSTLPAAANEVEPTNHIADLESLPRCPQRNHSDIFTPPDVVKPRPEVVRAFSVLKHHHFLRFQHHRMRPALVRSTKRIRSFIVLMLPQQRPLPVSEAPSLSETEAILKDTGSLPISPAPGMVETQSILLGAGLDAGSLPSTEPPNFETTASLIAEHLHAEHRRVTGVQ